MQSPENVSDAKRISGSAAVEKNVLSRVVSVWCLFVGLVVLVSVFHAICMQFPENVSDAKRISGSAAVKNSALYPSGLSTHALTRTSRN